MFSPQNLTLPNIYREDGTFVINNVPSGSYVVQVMNPSFMYEPLRVDINSKGKIRARAVNHIQPSNVVQVSITSFSFAEFFLDLATESPVW